MNLNALVSHLQKRLAMPLPGRSAQVSLMSEKALLDYDNRFKNQDISKARQSGVMILLYEKEGQVYIPLIKRPEYDGVHSGQIALPGGKAEPEDVDFIATALRETREEIGIPAEEITVLGMLTSLYIPPSSFLVNVVVGYHSGTPSFIPDAHEVASIIEMPLAHIQNKDYIEERSIATTTLKMRVPGYVYEGNFIWGATSMILSELKELITLSS